MGIAMAQNKITLSTLSRLLDQPQNDQNRSLLYSVLLFFSVVPDINTWYHAAAAVVFALVYCLVIISICLALYFRNYSSVFTNACFAISIPLRLSNSRDRLRQL